MRFRLAIQRLVLGAFPYAGFDPNIGPLFGLIYGKNSDVMSARKCLWFHPVRTAAQRNPYRVGVNVHAHCSQFDEGGRQDLARDVRWSKTGFGVGQLNAKTPNVVASIPAVGIVQAEVNFPESGCTSARPACRFMDTGLWAVGRIVRQCFARNKRKFIVILDT